jgi:hypothetical protein
VHSALPPHVPKVVQSSQLGHAQDPKQPHQLGPGDLGSSAFEDVDEEAESLRSK